MCKGARQGSHQRNQRQFTKLITRLLLDLLSAKETSLPVCVNPVQASANLIQIFNAVFSLSLHGIAKEQPHHGSDTVELP